MYRRSACVHVYRYRIHSRCQRSSELGFRAFGNGVTDGCERLCGCWELNPGLLEDQLAHSYFWDISPATPHALLWLLSVVAVNLSDTFLERPRLCCLLPRTSVRFFHSQPIWKQRPRWEPFALSLCCFATVESQSGTAHRKAAWDGVRHLLLFLISRLKPASRKPQLYCRIGSPDLPGY